VTWKPRDIVLSKRTGTVLEFVHYRSGVPVWNQLSPAGDYGLEGFDPAEPVLLARYRNGRRLPVLDLETYGEPRCYHHAGATWQGKCVDCGAVCAPNLDDAAEWAAEDLHLETGREAS
jgi:hypothetical protein